eukprot:6122859-Pyramimonas_sp.AAC.1
MYTLSARSPPAGPEANSGRPSAEPLEPSDLTASNPGGGNGTSCAPPCIDWLPGCLATWPTD